MDIQTFKAVASKLPPEIAVLMRGPTGIGKSHLARAAADELELPFIDVRLSTMSEGDVGGYPDIEGMKETGVMTFCMPSWFMRATKEPVVLMLDEMNRALPGVQQSAFQLVLDRELGNDKDGNPYKLHPLTRVFAAVNAGAEYDVNDMDPALLRRFWTIDLEPTNADWIDWAMTNAIDDVIIDFIRQNPAHLRVDVATVEPGTICPNPASWHRLNDSLAHMGWSPKNDSIAGGDCPAGFYAVAQGFVGTEAAISLSTFVKGYELVVTAEDVLERWDDVKDRVKEMNASDQATVIDRLSTHCKDNKWSDKQSKRIAGFSEELGGEMLIALWDGISQSGNLPNIQKVHKLIGSRVVSVVQESRNA